MRGCATIIGGVVVAIVAAAVVWQVAGWYFSLPTGAMIVIALLLLERDERQRAEVPSVPHLRALRERKPVVIADGPVRQQLAPAVGPAAAPIAVAPVRSPIAFEVIMAGHPLLNRDDVLQLAERLPVKSLDDIAGYLELKRTISPVVDDDGCAANCPFCGNLQRRLWSEIEETGRFTCAVCGRHLRMGDPLMIADVH